MSSRQQRIERLIDHAERALTSARASASAAVVATATAREEEARRERAWCDAAQRFGTGVVLVADLNEQAAHVRTLRLAADDGARQVERAVAEEVRLAGIAVEAAKNHRKLEMLRDRIASAQREDENRRERRASDELASRTSRNRP